jgi:hypothetical protein
MNCIEITYLRRYLREETAMIIGSLTEYKKNLPDVAHSSWYDSLVESLQ